MKIKISRRAFVILLIPFILVLAILSLALFVGFIFNRDTKELTFHASNVEYTKWQLPEGAITRFGKGTVNDIKFSPDGTQFAVATTIGVWIYDAKTGNENSLLEGDRQNILHVVYSSDGNTLKGIQLTNRHVNFLQWSTTTGKELSSIQEIGKSRYLRTSDFSSNGKRLVGIGGRTDNEVNLWSITDDTSPPTHKTIELDSTTKIGRSIALSSDGRLLATTESEEDNHPIHLWNTDSGELLNTFSGNSHRILNMSFSPGGTTLASADSRETVKIWDLNSNVSRGIYKDSYTSSMTLVFSPNGKSISSGNSDGNVHIWDVNDAKQESKRVFSQLKQLLHQKGHKDKILSLAFSPDGKMLISGSEDGTIRGWDVTSRKQLFISAGHSTEITALAEIKDENYLMSMHWLQNQILRWDINSGHQLAGTYLFNKNPEALSPDGMTLLIEEWFLFTEVDFKLLNIPKRRKEVILKGHNYNFSSSPNFVFSLDGKLLASADSQFRNPNGDILIWHIKNAKRSFFQTIFFRPKTLYLTHTLSGHTDRVTTMVFSPNGKMLASNGYDKKLCLWNVQTGENIFTESDYRVSGDALVFSLDSKILASGSYSRIILWDTTTGQQIKKTSAVEGANILMFSPDDKVLLSGTYTYGRLQLFDAQSLQHLSTHQGHSDGVNQLLFLTDEKSLVSTSEDGTMLLWDWDKISQAN